MAPPHTTIPPTKISELTHNKKIIELKKFFTKEEVDRDKKEIDKGLEVKRLRKNFELEPIPLNNDIEKTRKEKKDKMNDNWGRVVNDNENSESDLKKQQLPHWKRKNITNNKKEKLEFSLKGRECIGSPLKTRQ